jgi:hypothetical protein
MIRWVMVVAAVGLSSCCTTVGCGESVMFQLGAASQQFGVNETVEVKACVGSTCVTDTLTRKSGDEWVDGTDCNLTTNGALGCFVSGTGAGKQTVSVQLTKNGTVVLDETREGVTFTESNPNGLACGTCRRASVTL